MICTKILSHPVELTDAQKELAAALGVPPLVMAVLAGRKLTNPGAIRTFLEGKPDPFSDPFLLTDMDKAVERILKAVRSGEKITIYGDYDVDGTTGSSLLYLFLAGLGAQVSIYIPRRDSGNTASCSRISGSPDHADPSAPHVPDPVSDAAWMHVSCRGCRAYARPRSCALPAPSPSVHSRR